MTVAHNVDFLGIGAAKAGTTSMAKLLDQHPEIQISHPKELHFFDDDPSLGKKSLQWYLSQFQPGKVSGEITPSYLLMPNAAQNIHDVLGKDIKFLVNLRNPVDRAFSHYCHAVNNWHHEQYRAMNYPVEELSFMDALDQESDRLNSGDYHIRHLSYFTKGLYADQLKRYFRYFEPEQFHFVILEKFEINPMSEIQKVSDFLEVSPSYEFQGLTTRHNTQTRSSLDRNVRSDLLRRYEASISELEDLLHLDLWLWRI